MIRTPDPGDAEARLLHFPDLIETVEDSPVLLTALLAPEFGALPLDGLSISHINDIAVSAMDAGDMPAIRIGSGSGCGYVMRRPLDSQLVFIPDAGFNGLTFFKYTIADRQGAEAKLIATISVQPEPELAFTPEEEPQGAIRFSHGMQTVNVPSGVGGAILGAITVDHADPRTSIEMRVFEDDQASQSDRFHVLNGTLRLTQPLEHLEDGDIIKLLVEGVSGDKLIGRCSIEVKVADGTSDQFQFSRTFSPSQAEADEPMHATDDDVSSSDRRASEARDDREHAAVHPEEQLGLPANGGRSQVTEDDPFGV